MSAPLPERLGTVMLRGRAGAGRHKRRMRFGRDWCARAIRWMVSRRAKTNSSGGRSLRGVAARNC